MMLVWDVATIELMISSIASSCGDGGTSETGDRGGVEG